VAWLVAKVPEPPKADWLITMLRTGDAANSPAWAVAGRPVRVTVATLVQPVPSAESYPVTVSPCRARRSQRGDAVVTVPPRPAVSPV